MTDDLSHGGWIGIERHENVCIRGNRKPKLHQKNWKDKKGWWKEISPEKIDVKILI